MKSSVFAVLSAAPAALAAVRGFNYASQGQTYDSFVGQFRQAAALSGADDFTSARIYTMIQEGTTDTPVSAIQAAIDTKTTLLLGLWASVDQSAFDNEITALKNAIKQYGSDFADLVKGISVGSEDLYRISELGIENESGIGQSPDMLVDFIGQTRDAIKGTSLGNVPVGHVDTWNVYVNGSNTEVISACDFLGLDEYPYFQATDQNDISDAYDLFFEAYDKVGAVAGGKPIWITESGWPVSGPKSNLAVASTENAESFWQDVSCELQRREINFWWYILADQGASPSFGLSNNGKPLYDLSCKASSHSNSTSSSSNSTQSAHSTSGAHSSTTRSSGAAEATASGHSGSGSTASGQGPASTLATATQTKNGASSTGATAAQGTFTGAASHISRSILGVAAGAVLAAFAV